MGKSPLPRGAPRRFRALPYRGKAVGKRGTEMQEQRAGPYGKPATGLSATQMGALVNGELQLASQMVGK